MVCKLQKSTVFINPKTGFELRKACMDTEGSVLHNHDYYELFLTLTDNVYHLINGEVQYLKKGSLVFIRKDDAHCFNTVPDNKDVVLNIAFTEEILKSLFAFLSDGFPTEQLLKDANPPRVQLDPTEYSRILHSFSRANTIPIDMVQKRTLHCKKMIFEIFFDYFQDYYSEEASLSDIPLWLRDFNHDLKKAENFSKSTADIIKLSGKSREYLTRSVKKYYGLTLTNYINDIRLTYIANSLTTTDIDIINLMYDAGYQNISYAYSLFKKKYGMTPRMMREKNSSQIF